jgi:Flp pilus assembly pilin Flp
VATLSLGIQALIRTIVEKFRNDERGQNLSEYCLITALVALVGLVLFVHFSGGVQGLWTSANNSLAAGSPSTGGSGGHSTASAPAGAQQ